MPLTKLVFKPGVNRDQTNYAGEGGWWECNKIRFLSGFPQKLGGWAKYSVTAYLGVCRTLFNWFAAPNYNYLALGTSSKVYVDNGGTLNDITPILNTYTTASSPQDTDNCIATSINSTTVTVNINTHGALTGDYMTFAGVAAVGGIPATSFNGVQFYVTVVNANQFTITVDTAATSTVAAGGGTGITAYFYIHSGNSVASGGAGWGAPPWGGSGTSPTTGWGIAAVSPISNPLRFVYFASRYNGSTNYTDLLFNINNGPIYVWAVDPGFTFPTTNAIALSGTAVPAQVGQILYDTYSGILMAFGATPYGASTSTIDPLMVRWASQDDYTNWDPSTPASSTAGFLKIQTGSTILRAISNLGEILVFTERSVTSVTFVGANGTSDVFSQKLISSEISLIGPNAVAVVNNVYYWMGTDKFFSYNGRAETLPCTLRQHIFENINWSQSQQFFAASNERFFEVWWFYCSSESTTLDKYVIYNYAEGPAGIWYYGDCTDGMSRTAWSDSPLRQYPQGASGDDNYLYNHEQGTDAGTLPMTSYITSNNFDLEPDGNKFMLVRRLIPDVSFLGSNTASGVNPTVDFTLYPRNFPGSSYMTTNAEGQDFSRSVTQSSGSTVSVEQYTEQVFVRARARQLGVSIESSGVLGVNWQLGAPRLDMREDGTRG